MSHHTDPMERLRFVREEMARQNAKLPRVDHNGNPVEPAAPAEPTEEPEPSGIPAPNPALGSSSHGPPDLGAQIADAQKRGDVLTVLKLTREQAAHDASLPRGAA